MGNENNEEALEEQVAERQLRFEFTGNTRGYFRIWVVNTCLSLFTLGIFSAWAKVRKKRYLYSHTRLDGTPFQYLGRPIPILKGRIMAATLAVIWWAVAHFMPELSWCMLLLGLVLAPWVLVRSAAFNARYSAYRNITFHFDGRYGGLIGPTVGYGLLTAISCGLGYAWLRAKVTAYLVTHASFGGVPARFRLEGKHFFPTYLVSVFGFFALSMLVGLVVGLNVHKGFEMRTLEQLSYAFYALYFVAYVFQKVRITNLVWHGTRIGGLRFESTLSFRKLLWLYLGNSVAVIGTLGLLTPWAAMRTLKYRAACFNVYTTGNMLEFSGGDLSAVRATGAELGEFFDLDLAL